MIETVAVLLMLATSPLGEEVYKANKCAVCHSIAGVGNTKGPLDGIGKRLTPQQIREAIVNPKASLRKPNMKPVILPEEKLNVLISYLSGLK